MSHLDHFVNVTLGAGKLGGIFDANQNDEIKIVPHVVLVADVILIAHSFVIELGTVET